jgi:type I restriction enzyme, R subunit
MWRAHITLEGKARKKIDRRLAQCGWTVQNYRKMNILTSLDVTMSEFPLIAGEVDYLFYASR